jgi:small subunit ribosomal protein S6
MAQKGLRAEALSDDERKGEPMPRYEHVFLARQDITAQQANTLQKQFQTVVEENGGSVGKTEYWGLKSLSYKIKKNRKAHYTLMNIDAPHSAVAEMERQMSISVDILRFMTLKVKELDDKPTAMMRRSDDRDRERGDRGDRDRGGRGGGGGFRRDRDGPREGGFRGDGPREGGFRGDGPREGGFRGDGPREGGFRGDGPREGGGFRGDGPRGDRPPRNTEPSEGPAE